MGTKACSVEMLIELIDFILVSKEKDFLGACISVN